jgi:transposase InsO family protein
MCSPGRSLLPSMPLSVSKRSKRPLPSALLRYSIPTRDLKNHRIKISMDGRGRVFDNIFIERLWRTVKYEEVYLKDYATVWQAIRGLRDFFTRYNEDRPHSALGERTPYEVYYGAAETPKPTPEKEEGVHLKHAS